MKLHFLCGSAAGEALPLCLAVITAKDCLVLAGQSAASLAASLSTSLSTSAQCPEQILLLGAEGADSSGNQQQLTTADFAALCARCDAVICW